MIKEKKRKEFGEKSMVGLKSKEGYIKHVKKGTRTRHKSRDKIEWKEDMQSRKDNFSGETCNDGRQDIVENYVIMKERNN